MPGRAQIGCGCDPSRGYSCPLYSFHVSIWLLPGTPGRSAFAPRVLGGTAVTYAGHWRWSTSSRPTAHYSQAAVPWLFYFPFAFLLFLSILHLSPRWLFRRAKTYSKFMALLRRLKAPRSVHDTEYWLCEVRKWHSAKGRKAFQPRPLKKHDQKRIRRMLFLQSLLGCIFFRLVLLLMYPLFALFQLSGQASYPLLASQCPSLKLARPVKKAPALFLCVSFFSLSIFFFLLCLLYLFLYFCTICISVSLPPGPQVIIHIYIYII